MAFNPTEMILQYKNYSVTLAITIFILIAVCFSTNIIMDPLWYFKGNRVEEQNYVFNERLSKTNQYLKTSYNYDCIIFGSSRTALLNERFIENYECFNYSFSAGLIEEINAFAQYILVRGAFPRRVIIGVDDFNFIHVRWKISIPDFISTRSDPPTFFSTYLSLDSLDFSYRLLRHDSPRPRYYDNEFLPRILTNAPKYEPTIKNKRSTRVRTDGIRNYVQLRKLFNNVEVIGYAPPISAWRVASKSAKELKNYLGSLHRISRFIRPFYDFSIPSTITSATDNTYDGSHYDIETNKLIADRINERSRLFGIRIDTMSKEKYFHVYERSLKSFLASVKANGTGSKHPIRQDAPDLVSMP